MLVVAKRQSWRLSDENGLTPQRHRKINEQVKPMTSSVLTIGLIDEKFCPMEAIKYAESVGVSNVKAIQPQSPSHLDKAIKEAEKCDAIILDCKLFLDDDSYPCFSTEPLETVDGIAMSKAAKALYVVFKEMGKTVIGISAKSSEETCSNEMLAITKRLIQSAQNG